jgi:hypothetical protein
VVEGMPPAVRLSRVVRAGRRIGGPTGGLAFSPLHERFDKLLLDQPMRGWVVIRISAADADA